VGRRLTYRGGQLVGPLQDLAAEQCAPALGHSPDEVAEEYVHQKGVLVLRKGADHETALQLLESGRTKTKAYLLRHIPEAENTIRMIRQLNEHHVRSGRPPVPSVGGRRDGTGRPAQEAKTAMVTLFGVADQVSVEGTRARSGCGSAPT